MIDHSARERKFGEEGLRKGSMVTSSPVRPSLANSTFVMPECRVNDSCTCSWVKSGALRMFQRADTYIFQLHSMLVWQVWIHVEMFLIRTTFVWVRSLIVAGHPRYDRPRQGESVIFSNLIPKRIWYVNNSCKVRWCTQWKESVRHFVELLHLR